MCYLNRTSCMAIKVHSDCVPPSNISFLFAQAHGPLLVAQGIYASHTLMQSHCWGVLPLLEGSHTHSILNALYSTLLKVGFSLHHKHIFTEWHCGMELWLFTNMHRHVRTWSKRWTSLDTSDIIFPTDMLATVWRCRLMECLKSIPLAATRTRAPAWNVGPVYVRTYACTYVCVCTFTERGMYTRMCMCGV